MVSQQARVVLYSKPRTPAPLCTRSPAAPFDGGPCGQALACLRSRDRHSELSPSGLPNWWPTFRVEPTSSALAGDRNKAWVWTGPFDSNLIMEPFIGIYWAVSTRDEPQPTSEAQWRGRSCRIGHVFILVGLRRAEATKTASPSRAAEPLAGAFVRGAFEA